METTAPTAREQFVRDYLLVVENDQSAWNTLLEWAREEKNHATFVVFTLANRIQDEWEGAIFELSFETKDETLGLLVRQMLTGYGIDPFVDIAKYVLEQLAEQGE